MNVETMEGRTLFSVTVSQDYPGYYEITGDESADTIDVAVDMNAETFSLDGATYDGVAFIIVYGGGGDDVISLIASSTGYIGAAVDAGAGSDLVTVNFDGSIWAGEDDDAVYLSDAFRGEVYGDGGNDEIYVSGDCASPEIYGGAGDDRIDATENNHGVTIHGDDGNDLIYGSRYGDRIYGDSGADVIFGGAGSDGIYAGDPDADGAGDWIDGGVGSDTLDTHGYEIAIESIEHVI
jgi:Ca2+-binding RTX toxin-like protein